MILSDFCQSPGRPQPCVTERSCTSVTVLNLLRLSSPCRLRRLPTRTRSLPEERVRQLSLELAIQTSGELPGVRDVLVVANLSNVTHRAKLGPDGSNRFGSRHVCTNEKNDHLDGNNRGVGQRRGSSPESHRWVSDVSPCACHAVGAIAPTDPNASAPDAGRTQAPHRAGGARTLADD